MFFIRIIYSPICFPFKPVQTCTNCLQISYSNRVMTDHDERLPTLKSRNTIGYFILQNSLGINFIKSRANNDFALSALSNRSAGIRCKTSHNNQNGILSSIIVYVLYKIKFNIQYVSHVLDGTHSLWPTNVVQLHTVSNINELPIEE